MKACKKCGEEKSEAEFYKRKDRYSMRNECKSCINEKMTARYWKLKSEDPEALRARAIKFRLNRNEKAPHYDREKNLQRNYGIGIKEYEEMMQMCGGVCESCGAPPIKDWGLQVDHDHKTGRIRGLLCSECNMSLGKMKESVVSIMGLLSYANLYCKGGPSLVDSN